MRPNRHTASATSQDSDEQPDDAVAGVVERDVGDRGERAGGDVGLVGEHADQLDGADDQRDGDRDAGDRDVVEDLADRLGERPAVGGVHEHAVDGVHQAHAGREQDRQHQDRVERQVERRRAAGEDQQADLGGGVEAEPEQHADRVDVPGLAHALGQAAEEAVHEAALVQLLLELGLVVLARAASRGRPARIPSRTTRLRMPRTHRNTPGHRRADDAGDASAAWSCRPRPGRRAPSRRPRAGTASANTIVEWPRENQKPTDSGLRLASPGRRSRPSACGWCCRPRRCGRRRRRGAGRTCRPGRRRRR